MRSENSYERRNAGAGQGPRGNRTKLPVPWISRRGALPLVLVLALMLVPCSLGAQEIVKQALAGFPARTFRLEYSNSSKLRTLPNYASLRQHYLAPRLRKLQESLAQLGIQESDVDEVVLGWQAAATAKPAGPEPGDPGGSASSMDLYGLAAGRFNAQALAAGASARGLAPTTAAGHEIYCLGSEAGSTCIVLLSNSLGAFATLDSLSSILEARQGKAPGLNSDARFTSLLNQVKTEAPVWGVAAGPAVADWFRTYMPSQDNKLQLDWSQAFNTVEDLVYSVDAGDKVRLDVNLDCTSAAEAMNLRQVLNGLRAFQQMAWQAQHPNQPNPFEALEVNSSDRRVNLKLTTSYSAVGQ
jgi:hypothetical protein